MKILLVYPEYPETFWSLRHALRMMNKKALVPPLGIITVAAMLPQEWEKKLVDMNIEALTDKDIQWADYVFISAMLVQRDSAKEVITRSRRFDKKIVAGGPLFQMEHEAFPDIDHFVLGEGEITLPIFLKDLAGERPRHFYNSEERPDITQTPVPLWPLVDKKKYSLMAMQYSRGCPFDCDFCDIIIFNGRKPRTKTKEQVIAELNAIYDSGWREGVFIVDDNFIGDKRKLKEEILPAIIEWNRAHDYIFPLFTEACINLADDEELMDLMAQAGFTAVFIGVETTSEKALAECNKDQNRNRDMIECVKTIQRHGMEVWGGFIVGFDSDPLTIFQDQINFIRDSGIVIAMVGLLNAGRGTPFYERLEKENRLIEMSNFYGDNTGCSINFIPRMKMEVLFEGYFNILKNIYSPREYYERISTFIREYRPPKLKIKRRLYFYHLRGLFGSIWHMGILESGRRYYWKFFFRTLFRHPRNFPYAVIYLTNCGYHFRKVFETYVRMPVREIVKAHKEQPHQRDT
ncbi:MAG: B12-binding domain-containing radical SAM protein [Deltaproteobacteria bacterium HGW-Deltaproteobacteria-13]|jgi:radical SAM superfamily enzyme YgiQ (UPF0313 family)|nr:MAG: B12-binding domain-containing radical SAM protein [Deltaproteobacteria bacterium HGW-Deltaproteobacteria-13]